ncbi:hypothetical protein DPO11_14595 [Salmonella enterica]|nr:hypothetical protein [Salmonella enterica]
MKRIVEILTRLNALNDFLEPMLKQPYTDREQAQAVAQIKDLLEHVERVNSVLCAQQERGTLSDFEKRDIQPIIFEIWLHTKIGLTEDGVTVKDLDGELVSIIGQVSFYLQVLERRNYSKYKNGVLH